MSAWRRGCPRLLAAFALLSATASVGRAAAADLPAAPAVDILRPIEEWPLKLDARLQPPPATEAPPSLLSGGWRVLFLTTSYSWMCSTAQRPGPATLIDVTKYCDYAQWPDDRPPPQGKFVASARLDGSTRPWARNYSGIFSAEVVPDAQSGKEIVAVVHGENKNERIADEAYQNSVSASPAVADCFSGLQGGRYADCNAAYYAFISLSAAPFAEKYQWGRGHFTDYGPAIWPSGGYLDAGGRKISDGVRHPSSIVDGGYLYVYYLDGGVRRANIPGRAKGIKVARAPLAPSGPPRSFVPYFQGGFDPANPSLPEGFDRGTIERFYAMPGGRADNLFPDSAGSIRFSVARVRGAGLYAGVDEFCDWSVKPRPACSLRLRLSRDLLTWGPPTTIPTTEASGWEATRLHYPLFMDKGATTHSEIDPQDFWILGTSTNYRLEALRLRIETNPP